MINNQTHIIASVTPHLLNPGDPASSSFFEKAAVLQKTLDCEVTALHITPPHSMGRSIEEALALKVLINRVNDRLNVNFRSRTETGEVSFNLISSLVVRLNGDLLLRECEPEVDTTSISLLESAPYPVWYVCSESEISEINAKVSADEESSKEDLLTCSLAQELGQEMNSDVGVLRSVPTEAAAGDLVVTCVPSPKDASDKELKRRRQEAVNMLRSPLEYDLLIHRGARVGDFPLAA